MFFDPAFLLLVLLPSMLLMGWAQMRVRSAYSRGMRVPSRLSGAAAARYILDESGLHDVAIEETRGHLSDHYDPRHKVLRLSREVYHTRSATAVGIAAHEAGHALQDAHKYLPLVVRNAAVPAATWGSSLSMILLMVGLLLASAGAEFGQWIFLLGILSFGCLLLFQLVNLPVEFDASNRAKRLLVEMNIVDPQGSGAVGNVLNAAAWTYVAATVQSLLTVLYYVWIFSGMRRSN